MQRDGFGRAFGFRVKSGFAIAVVLEGPAAKPAAIARHIVELCDPAQPDTRQPYHSNVGEAEENERDIATRTRLIERAAAASVQTLIEAYRDHKLHSRATLVVGSVIDPATVGNPHIRAHANEGRLFRMVLEEALRAHGLTCAVVVEKQLAAHARARLQRTEADVTRTLAALGKTLGAPWRSEEKAAALGAWIAL